MPNFTDTASDPGSAPKTQGTAPDNSGAWQWDYFLAAVAVVSFLWFAMELYAEQWGVLGGTQASLLEPVVALTLGLVSGTFALRLFLRGKRSGK